MFGFLGKVLGTDKALSKTVGMLGEGLDALVYTDEERAGDAAKQRTEGRQTFIEWVKASQGQNLSRRIIALMVVVAWLSQYLTATVLRVIAVWADATDKYMQSGQVIADSAEGMIGAVMLIISFYFAAPYMDKIVVAAMSKFSVGVPNKK